MLLLLSAGALDGRRDGGELLECCCEVLDDLAGDDLGRGQVVEVLKGLGAQPRDVEVGLIAGDKLVVVEINDDGSGLRCRGR
ncbi:hypothetical protein [Streptomyces sp. HC307]|uniref:hypothetical protein n=1 Tax=Streptomyces flavusporus TaxID=3385496 RepID=UPI0039173A5B